MYALPIVYQSRPCLQTVALSPTGHRVYKVSLGPPGAP
jgi:hypothetical protein